MNLDKISSYSVLIKKEKIQKITELLKRDFPVVNTPLLHQSAFQLLAATMMSAQTLDATVNKVSPEVFRRFPNAESMAKADPDEIDSIIRIVNYHRTKSKNLVRMAQQLIENFSGVVPSSIENLTTLPGIGRKTANVVISEWFAKPLNMRGTPDLVDSTKIKKGEDIQILPEGFVVDTHVIRVSNRLGLTKHKDPVKIEQDLMKLFPREEWNDMSLRMIFHGRNRCKSRPHLCCEDPEWSKLCSCD